MDNGLVLAMSVAALVSAKWAMELGFNQLSQLLWAIAGFFLGPLVLLILYVRFLYKQRDDRGVRQGMSQSLPKEL